MTIRKTVLIVEDETKLGLVLSDYLHDAGYETQWERRGDSVVERIRSNPPDLVLLDLMLPGGDGVTICQELRAFSDVPIIMITARVDEVDRLLGLEIGADDYICKPYSPREVIARVKAILRRTAQTSGPEPRLDSLVLNPEKMEALLEGKPLELTTVEFRLLQTLASAPGRIFTRDRLLTEIHSHDRIVTDRAIDSHIKNIRKKIAVIIPEREVITSVYGVGYKLEL